MLMRKELQIAAALVAVLASPALAQDTTPAGQQAAPMPAPPTGSTPTPARSSTSPVTPSATDAPATSLAGGLPFINMQQNQETLASTLIGTEVRDGADQPLGDINDVLLDADGRLKAVVVGVGGFLGVAERDVAVPWETFGVSPDEDGDLMLRLEVSREQLENAPEFESVKDRRLAEEAARAAQTPPGGVGTGAGGAVVPAPVPGATPTTPAQ
jgi:hypothetical protein